MEFFPLLSLPLDILDHILSFACPVDHLSLCRTSRALRSLYLDRWKYLVQETFGKSYLVCGCSHEASSMLGVKMSDFRDERLFWKSVFIHSLRQVWALEQGAFDRLRSYVYKITETSHHTLVIRQLHKQFYLLSRQVNFDGTSVDFIFRDLYLGRHVATWHAPLLTIFPDFHPIRNRIHVDLEVYGPYVMAVYYDSDRNVRRVFLWNIPVDISQLPQAFDSAITWTPPEEEQRAAVLAQQLALSSSSSISSALSSTSVWTDPPASQSGGVPNGLSGISSVPACRWVRFRPPHIAIDGKDFCLWDVSKNACVYTIPESNGSVAAAAWDRYLIVTAHNTGVIRIGRPAFVTRCGSVGSKPADMRAGDSLAPGVGGGDTGGDTSLVSRTTSILDNYHTYPAAKPFLEIPVDFPFFGRYLGFFRTGSGERDFAILAASDPRTCHVVWGRGDPTKKFTLPKRLRPEFSADDIAVLAEEAEDEIEETGSSVFLPPQGFMNGQKGPFLVWSNGLDTYWFRAHARDGLDKPMCLPRWWLDLSDQYAIPDETGQAGQVLTHREARQLSSGLCRAMVANTDLVQIWTNLVDKTVTVSILRPNPGAVRGPASLPCILCCQAATTAKICHKIVKDNASVLTKSSLQGLPSPPKKSISGPYCVREFKTPPTPSRALPQGSPARSAITLIPYAT